MFSYFYGDEYWDYKNTTTDYKVYEQQVELVNIDFTSQEIKEIWKNSQIFQTPDIELLDFFVWRIESSRERVYLEAYIFTEKRMRDAIIAAHNRWLDVKVLLENNPYKAPYLNDAHYTSLKDSGVDVRWSDPLNYSLNHAKMLIVDDETFVSTGNFSYSLFKYNMDFIISVWDEEIQRELEKLFLLDFYHEKWWVFHPNIVLSPDNSRVKITNLIANATQKIDFYFPYMADEALEKLLIQKAVDWIEVRGVVGKEFYKENFEHIKELKNSWLDIRPLSHSKLHAKTIIIDDKIMYIGSINFSSYSLDENREIWLLIRDASLVVSVTDMFSRDFTK